MNVGKIKNKILPILRNMESGELQSSAQRLEER